MSASPGALSLVDVDKSFPGVHALKRVSIEIGHGEVVGLIGENGAGKSTLMKILSGVYQPDGGQILIAMPPRSALATPTPMNQVPSVVMKEGMVSLTWITPFRNPTRAPTESTARTARNP